MLPPDTDPASLAGLEIVDRRGERLGRVRQVYPDDGRIAWVGVRGNLIGTTEALVPVDDAELDGETIQVPITRARFLSAPRRTPDVELDDTEKESMRAFYSAAPPAPQVVAVVEPEPDPEETADGTGQEADEAAHAPAAPVDEVVRSEQRLQVATQPVPRERVVLRKVVVTEQRTITVPVRREEVRLVRETIEDAEPVTGAVLEESDQELVLHEERVVVTTEVVPIERIRLVREIVTEEKRVTGEVWREQVEGGGDADAG